MAPRAPGSAPSGSLPRARPPPAGRSSGPALQSELQGAPPRLRLHHAPGSLGVGSPHSVFASLLPHLLVQPPPPKRRITSSGRYTDKTRALPGEKRLQVCKSGKLAATSQHSQQGASGWEITCLVLTQKEKRAHSCCRSSAVTESGWGLRGTPQIW